MNDRGPNAKDAQYHASPESPRGRFVNGLLRSRLYEECVCEK